MNDFVTGIGWLTIAFFAIYIINKFLEEQNHHKEVAREKISAERGMAKILAFRKMYFLSNNEKDRSSIKEYFGPWAILDLDMRDADFEKNAVDVSYCTFEAAKQDISQNGLQYIFREGEIIHNRMEGQPTSTNTEDFEYSYQMTMESRYQKAREAAKRISPRDYYRMQDDAREKKSSSWREYVIKMALDVGIFVPLIENKSEINHTIMRTMYLTHSDGGLDFVNQIFSESGGARMLYGLCALYFLDRKEFNSACLHCIGSNEPINIKINETLETVTIGQLMEKKSRPDGVLTNCGDISSGEIPEYFMKLYNEPSIPDME